MEKIADCVREAASERIKYARRQGDDTVDIRVGDVVRELGLVNRTPSVCSALSSPAFLRDNDVSLERTVGPPSGQSTTTVYTYRIAGSSKSGSTLLAMRGVGKETFAALGGGEAFLKAERAAWESQ